MPFYPFIDVESTHCSSRRRRQRRQWQQQHHHHTGHISRSGNGCHTFCTLLTVQRTRAAQGRQCCRVGTWYSTKKNYIFVKCSKQPTPGTKQSGPVCERPNRRTGLDKVVCCIISCTPCTSYHDVFCSDFTTHIYMTLLSAHDQRRYIV